MATLRIVDGPARGQRFDLSRLDVMIGRDAACAIPIADDRVSRRHLQLAYDGRLERYLAIDVGSSNGVTVNGVRLVRGIERPLDDGDEIVIGGSTLRYSSEAPGPE